MVQVTLGISRMHKKIKVKSISSCTNTTFKVGYTDPKEVIFNWCFMIALIPTFSGMFLSLMSLWLIGSKTLTLTLWFGSIFWITVWSVVALVYFVYELIRGKT